MFERFSGARRRNGVIATMAAVTAVVFALSGCSGSGGGDSSDSATSGSITWWGWTPEIGVGKQYIEAFNKDYPNIKVTYKQVADDLGDERDFATAISEARHLHDEVDAARDLFANGARR